MSSTATCPSCAGECPAGARFCPRCGAALAVSSSQAVERRVVTTMFCDIIDFTGFCERVDPEEADAVLREFYALARHAIETYGGVVEKFVGDAVVGIFGVPSVHEDDSERAVWTAIRLLDRLPALPRPGGEGLEVRIGINTGTAIVRLDVVPGSGEGFLVGDAVNTAARLQKLAPPMGIVVGEKTQALTTRRIAYEPLEPVAVKGKRGRVGCWLVRGPISRMGVDLRREFPARLVDREVELGMLRGLLKKVRASWRPQFAMVVGEAGIGKSRLVFEFLRYVDSRPQIVSWRQGHCPAYGDGLTFWALGEIVREQLGLGELDTVDSVEAKLAEALQGRDDAEWLAARLRPLLGLDSPSASREENFAAWRRFLEDIAAQSPAVLVFEDLHWASDATLAFLSHLFESARDVPLLVVGTTRPELFRAHPDIADRLAVLGSTNRGVRVSLSPLSDSETRELVARVGRGLGRLKQTQGAIIKRSAGNPLFVEQLVRHLEAQGTPGGRRGADVALKERAAEALPESLQSLIAARLDELPPDRKILLADAAVIGEVFWSGAVAALDHGDRGAAEEGLDDLVGRDLVRHERSSSVAGESEFAFRHALIRDVAYGQLTRADRAAKHAVVARWVEATAGERVDEVAEILAHHFATALELAHAAGDVALEGGLLAPAIEALRLAGDRAMSLDVKAAERYYARALAFAGDGAGRPRLLVAWAEALEHAGRISEAAEALDEGVHGLRALGEDNAATAASARRWELHWLLADGHVLSADEVAQAAESDDGEESSERITVLENLASRAVHVGSAALAARLADRAVAMGRRLGLAELPSALMWRGMAACAAGEAGGLDDLSHALELAKAQGRGHETCSILANLGEFLDLFEGPEAGMRVHREGLDLARRRNDELATCFCREVLFVDQVWAGWWDAALAESDDLDRLLDEHNDLWDLQVLRSTVGLVRALRGDAEGAEEVAAWAEERSRVTPLVAVRAACLISLARVGLAQGDEAAALRLLDECRPLASAACVPDFSLRMPEAVRLALELGQPRLAQDLATGLPATRPYDAATLATLDALLRESRGERAEAAGRFAEARDRWAALGVPYERAQAALGRGRCLAALGDDPAAATKEIASARDAFAALRARPALSEAAEALQAVGG